MALKQEVLELTDFEESAMNEGIQKGKIEGKIEGKLEGRLEAKQGTLKSLLIRKFKSISEEIALKIDTCTDISKLESGINNIFDYTQASDVLDTLK